MNNLILFRQQVITLARQFFLDRKFQEFTIPILNPSLPLEQNIYSYQTTSTTSKTNYYLPTSPESALKKIIAAGFQHDCFAISPSFRNLESTGPYHQPEFLMLEFYQIGQNYLEITPTLENLVTYIIQGIGHNNQLNTNKLFTTPYPRQTLKDLFHRYADIDLGTYLAANFSEPDFNQLFLNQIEPHLPQYGPTFILDYPAFISPLAAPLNPTNNCQATTNNLYSQRFELYINGIEIANGNTENTDSESIKTFMETENHYRQQRHLPTHPIDNDFIQSCGQLPLCAGCGLGLDRLAMLLSGATNISQLLPFPL
jgi:lysyl-tRNA synthetase class 2